MKLEKGVYSNAQLFFLIISLLQCMILTINFNYSITKEDTWIAILVAYVIAIPMALVYTSIAQRFAGKNLVQINDAVFGSYVGKLFSILYIWFFFQLLIHYLYLFNSFWITYIMPETPRIIFLIMAISICAFSIKCGLEVIARCNVIFVLLVVFMVLSVSFLMIKDMKPSNLLPLFQTPPKVFIQSVHIILTIGILDVVGMLMIFPYSLNNDKLRKPLLLAITFSVALMLVVVLRDTLVLGARAYTSTSASFAISREINIADVLNRLDILVALILFISAGTKITLFYYATILSVAQTLKLHSYQPLIMPVGALAVAIAVKLYSSDMAQVYAAEFIWPFNASFYEIILPLITLIVMAIRKLPKKEE